MASGAGGARRSGNGGSQAEYLSGADSEADVSARRSARASTRDSTRHASHASSRSQSHGSVHHVAQGSAQGGIQGGAKGGAQGGAQGGAYGGSHGGSQGGAHGGSHGGSHVGDLKGASEDKPNEVIKSQFSDSSMDSLIDETTDIFYGQLVPGTRYRLGKRIGTGNFGHVRLARQIETSEQLAVKVEPADVQPPQLLKEWEFYKVLNETPAVGIPKAFYYGPFGNYNAMVYELLGPSLEQMFKICDRKFSLHTILMIAVQLIDRLEFVHSCHIVHRDVKPDNFLICKTSKRDQTIYIVDFGLGKYFFDPASKTHISLKTAETCAGTPRYMSMNAHIGLEQSRRDDLEGLGYCLIYFLRSTLPWQGFETESFTNLQQSILTVKKSIGIEELCEGQPQLVQYMKYVRALDFDTAPDYAYLRQLFMRRMEKEGYNPNGKMDWSSKIRDKARMRKLQRQSK